MTKHKQTVLRPALVINLDSLESISEQLEITSEERRERIREIKLRGWV